MISPAIDGKQRSHGTAYLESLLATHTVLTSEKIKTILAAAILRYLGGRTSIHFILELHAAITHSPAVVASPDVIDITVTLAKLEHDILCKHERKVAIDARLRDLLPRLLS